MKKVLILAYDFYPYVSVGGLRPYSWFKYFNEFGLYPIVVTRNWENKHGNQLDYILPSIETKTLYEQNETGLIIRTPYKQSLSNKLLYRYGANRFKNIRKLLTGLNEILQFFFLIGTKINIYYAAKEYISNNNVDFIMATGSPHILFKYASKLSKAYNIKWIADYRDPWSQSKSRSPNKFMKALNVFFEKKYLANVSIITTVSEFGKSQISALLPKDKIYIIPNGYDTNINNSVQLNHNSTLSFAFTGSIYKWHPFRSVLSVLNRFVAAGNNIRINFYGINKTLELNKLLELEFNKLKPCVNVISKIPYDDLMHQLSKNDVMILFNDYYLTGTKLFDYLSTKRLVLLCYKEDNEGDYIKRPYQNYNLEESESNIQEKTILKTNSGIIVNNSKHLFEVLFDLYKEHQKTGNILCQSKEIEQYSRKEQVKKLCSIIKTL